MDDPTQAQLRTSAFRAIETLEAWLRRLLHYVLTQEHGGNYFDAIDASGGRIYSSKLVKGLKERVHAHPDRFPRLVDALHLNEAIQLACSERLWKSHTGVALGDAFHAGRDTTRKILSRLVDTRHRLAHHHHLGDHACYQAITYARDTVLAVRQYFAEKSSMPIFDAPFFVAAKDSLGHVWHFQEEVSGPYVLGNQRGSGPVAWLFPGDHFRLELRVDDAFDVTSYRVEIRYYCQGSYQAKLVDGATVSLDIERMHICAVFMIQARVIGNAGPHRHGAYDDEKTFHYGVRDVPRV